MVQLFNYIKTDFKLILATRKVIMIAYIWIYMLKQWEKIVLIELCFLYACILVNVAFFER